MELKRDSFYEELVHQPKATKELMVRQGQDPDSLDFTQWLYVTPEGGLIYLTDPARVEPEDVEDWISCMLPDHEFTPVSDEVARTWVAQFLTGAAEALKAGQGTPGGLFLACQNLYDEGGELN